MPRSCAVGQLEQQVTELVRPADSRITETACLKEGQRQEAGTVGQWKVGPPGGERFGVVGAGHGGRPGGERRGVHERGARVLPFAFPPQDLATGNVQGRKRRLEEVRDEAKILGDEIQPAPRQQPEDLGALGDLRGFIGGRNI